MTKVVDVLNEMCGEKLDFLDMRNRRRKMIPKTLPNDNTYRLRLITKSHGTVNRIMKLNRNIFT